MTKELKKERKESIALSVRVMTNTDAYKYASGWTQKLMKSAAKEMGEINFKYAHSETIISDDLISENAEKLN